MRSNIRSTPSITLPNTFVGFSVARRQPAPRRLRRPPQGEAGTIMRRSCNTCDPMEGRPTDDGVAPRHEPRRDQLYAVSDGGMIAEISMAGTPAVPTFAGGPGP